MSRIRNAARHIFARFRTPRLIKCSNSLFDWQVNVWDQLLLKNGDKILALNESVAAVRQDQQRLEHELDFVAGQQVRL
jgi:hypothetical protein